MARRMIRRRRGQQLATVAALRCAQHAERRGLPRWAIVLACRLATDPPVCAAIGGRAELERLFGRRATLAPVSRHHPDLWLARHDDPLARVHLRRADRAWQVRQSRSGDEKYSSQ